MELGLVLRVILYRIAHFYPLYPRLPQSGKVNSSSKQCTDLNTSVINSESPVMH